MTVCTLSVYIDEFFDQYTLATPSIRPIFIYSYSYILQANEQNIKISIKQTQTQPQYSMPHGRRRVATGDITYT